MAAARRCRAAGPPNPTATPRGVYPPNPPLPPSASLRLPTDAATNALLDTPDTNLAHEPTPSRLRQAHPRHERISRYRPEIRPTEMSEDPLFHELEELDLSQPELAQV